VLTARQRIRRRLRPTLLNENSAEVNIHRHRDIDLPFWHQEVAQEFITGGNPPRYSHVRASAGKPHFLKRALEDVLLPDPQVTCYGAYPRARRIVRERKH